MIYFDHQFYKFNDYASLLVPNKRKMEGKAAVHTEGTKYNKQEQTTTKDLAMQIHANIDHPK